MNEPPIKAGNKRKGQSPLQQTSKQIIYKLSSQCQIKLWTGRLLLYIC